MRMIKEGHNNMPRSIGYGKTGFFCKGILAISLVLNVGLIVASAVLYGRLITTIDRVSVSAEAMDAPLAPKDTEVLFTGVMSQIGEHISNLNDFCVTWAACSGDAFVVEMEPVVSLLSNYTILLDGRTSDREIIHDYFGARKVTFSAEMELINVE